MKTTTKTAAKFIRNQTVIRMTIGSNGGYGDQAACLHTIRWLRSLGFNGQVEIIYGRIVYKLVKLLGIEDNFDYDHPFELTDESIILINIKHFLAQRGDFEPVELLIAPTGSAGNFDDIHLPLEQIFKAKYAVILDNYPQVGPRHAIHFPIPALEDAARFLADSAKSFLLTRKPGLPALMQAIAQKQVTPWSLYGLSVEFDKVNASVIIEALGQVAQNINNHGLITGPILLLLHNELSQRDLASLTAFPLWDVRDPALQAKLDQVQANQIILINVGMLPTIVFDALVKESKFPVLLEGANLETIMLILRRVSLDCGFNGENSNSYIINAMNSYNISGELRRLIKDVGEICVPEKISPSLIKKVTRFVRLALNPDSQLRQFMNEIGDYYHTPSNDRHLHSVTVRLAGPKFSSFPKKISQNSTPLPIDCDKNFHILLLYGNATQIVDCIGLKKIDLISYFFPINRRSATIPGFLFLLANDSPGLHQLTIAYLKKNRRQICSTLPASEPCISWMRDFSIAGNARAIKEVVEYCRPELAKTNRLQDAISEFCHEPIFPKAVAPARQLAQHLVQFLALNISTRQKLAAPTITSPTFESPAWGHMFLVICSALVIAVLAMRLCRGALSNIVTTGRYWLYSQRMSPSNTDSSLNYTKKH